jgi:hypothetical protein
VKGDEHEALDTAIYSPLGDEDKQGLDLLLTTVESLFGHKTAEDYKALDLQAMVIQSSSAALGEDQHTDNTRPPQALHDLKVKVETHKALDTAVYTPLGAARESQAAVDTTT